MSRRRDLLPISEALAGFTRDVQPQSMLAELQRVWPDAVGATLAAWATPVSETAGTVVVECADSVVAHELEMLRSDLLGRLAEALPDRAPRDLKFRVR